MPKIHSISVLRKRAEFLAVAGTGKKWVAPGLILQMGVPGDAVRFGLTASVKVGNAVVRNRARRRLRALAMEILPQAAPRDYVLIARANTAARNHEQLKGDLVAGLKKLGVWNDAT